MTGDDFAKALDRYLPDSASVADKTKTDDLPASPGCHISFDRLPIQASLDLHGQTLAQARQALDRFLKAAANQGLRKVLIIHGKGEGVLQVGVRQYLEGHPLAGKRTVARRHEGGSGALLVMVRQK